MHDHLIPTWNAFVDRLKIFPEPLSTLNPPCPEETIREAERRLGFRLPSSLAVLLRLNNGQQLDSPGLFKSVSGWDVYRRSIFLDAESIATAYQSFLRDEVLVASFGTDEIPFALAGSPDSFDEVFSIHRETQDVSLIWTASIDPFTPADWQVSRFPRGADLATFLETQIALYR
jgi:hypothetical protein